MKKFTIFLQILVFTFLSGQVFAYDPIDCHQEVTSASIGSPKCTWCNKNPPEMVDEVIWIYPGYDGEPGTDEQLNQLKSSSIGFSYFNVDYSSPYIVTPTVSGTYTEKKSVTGGFTVSTGFETEAKFSLPFNIAKNSVSYSLGFEAAVEGTSEDGLQLFGGFTGEPTSVPARAKITFYLRAYSDTYVVTSDTGKKGPNYFWNCPECNTRTAKVPLVTTVTSETVTCTGFKYSLIQAEGPYWAYNL